MSVGFNTPFSKVADSKFVIRNNASKALKIFNIKIDPAGSYDLMSIPEVSEADIMHSLLKGTLKNKISLNEIVVTESNINLAQHNAEFIEFLRSAGITVGVVEGGTTSASNLAALSQLEDGAMSDGTSISVATVSDSFILDKTNTDTVDNITVVSTKSGTGRWLRNGINNKRWLAQEKWYINATTGNDENDGSDGHQIKTWGEWARRTGSAPLMQPTTIYVETDLEEASIFFDIRSNCSLGLTVIGTRTVIGTGSFSGVQDYDDSVSPGDDGQITDATLPVSWTASGFVERLIVITSGANAGAAAWVVKDLGAKTARHSPFWNTATWAFIDPQVGETYEVVTLTRLQGGITAMAHQGRVTFESIDMYGGTFLAGLAHEGGVFIAYFCRIGGYSGFQFESATSGDYYGCLFQTSHLPFSVRGGRCFLAGCCIAEQVTVDRPGVFFTIRNSIAQFGLGSGNVLGLDLAGGGTVEVSAGHYFAVFDSDQADDAAFTVRNGGIVRLEGKVWGLDWDNNFGLWVDSGCQILYPSPDNLTAHADVQGTGQVSEVRYGGINTTYAAIGLTGVVNLSNLAMVVPSGM